jgi:hypothetical protein
MKILHRTYVLVAFMLAPGILLADDWYYKIGGQVLYKAYSGSAQLSDFTGLAGYLSADYLERGGFSLGFHVNQTDYQADQADAPRQADENILYLGGKLNTFPDVLPGKLTLRVDAYLGRDELRFSQVVSQPGPMGGSSSRQTYTVRDDFWAVNPIISFLNYEKTFYADLGYAYSSYDSSDSGTDNISIQQWTPTLGLGFNRAYDWLQLRAYLIHLSDSNRITNKEATSALEIKWDHWFGVNPPLGLHRVGVNMLTGERIYAIDSDACGLCTVPDLQDGVIALGAEWLIAEQASLLLQVGQEKYQNLLLADRYVSNYLYVYMSRKW